MLLQRCSEAEVISTGRCSAIIGDVFAAQHLDIARRFEIIEPASPPPPISINNSIAVALVVACTISAL